MILSFCSALVVLLLYRAVARWDREHEQEYHGRSYHARHRYLRERDER